MPRAGRRSRLDGPPRRLARSSGCSRAGYAIAVVRLGPRCVAPGRPVVTRFQVTCWSLGVFAMWVASDWPIHDIAERYNYSVHMVQHLMFTMVAAPLLLLGTPGVAAALDAAARPAASTSCARCARFVPALLIFNVVLVFTHWPAMVNASLDSGCVHFAHARVLFVSSLDRVDADREPAARDPAAAAGDADALPVRVVGRADGARRRSSRSARHRSTSSTSTCRTSSGSSTLEDQQLAGLIMKIGAGLLLWLIIAVVFFRWAAEEERANTPRHGLDELDRELTEMGLRR